MAKQETRQAIIDAFVERVEKSSLSSVRVAELISSLGINRNSFYYYFPSKFDVAMSVFFEDMDRKLCSKLPTEELVYSTLPGKDSLDRRYAIYTHVETGARTLDASEFTRALMHCIIDRHSFYRKLFRREELDFELRVKNLYEPLIASDVDFMLGGRFMPEQTRRMLVSLGTSELITCAELCAAEPDDSLLSEQTNPFANIIHESLFNAIQSHPVKRQQRR